MKRMFIKGICLLFVTFFSVISVTAASFEYSEFDWQTLLENNLSYWVSACDKEDEKCYDVIIKTQEQFYKRLYFLLTEFQNKHDITIDDKIIIETAFYGLSPNAFRDPVENEKNPYNLDEETENKYIGEVSETEINLAQEYFARETDSLKTLMNNMVTYTQICYGITDEEPKNDANGNPYCENSSLTLQDGKCVAKLDDMEVSFFEALFSDVFDIFNIFGFYKSENYTNCKELAKDYKGHILGDISDKKILNVDLYWEFLINSDYFDKKDHLQSYFKAVLDETGHSKMSELTEEEYKQNEDVIKLARKVIVNNIKSILESYNRHVKNDVNMSAGKSNNYWWPIGSVETTETNGIVFASGEPESVNVTSKYGMRTDPVTGEANSNHNGIDISGTVGSTNVIAAKSGTVVALIDDTGGACVEGDTECGGGYGNYVIIQHLDNNYTLYAHLNTSSIAVKSGDTVEQGQVIAKVGSTGKSTGGHLHFEVRVGGNDSASTQDPLNFIAVDNARATATMDNQILEWIGNMEGSGEIDGDSYVVYADSGGVLTVGHGITLKYNADDFKAYGIDPGTLSVGSRVSKEIVDKIYFDDVSARLDDIKSKISAKGVTLNDNQIAALASLQFNCGNINGFFEAYNKYGSTESLCTNWWEQKALHDKKGNYLRGLKKRRVAECDLFVNNQFNMNVYD